MISDSSRPNEPDEAKLVFVTFGAGRRGWKDASKRISEEAENSSIFDVVHCLDETWLQKNDPEIHKVVLEILERCGSRGFGYWVWKPAILVWAMNRYPNSSVLYMDAGSHIDLNPILLERFASLLSENGEFKELAWTLPEHPEIEWTKSELLDRLSASENQIFSDQIQSGFIFLSPSSQAKEFTKNFRALALENSGFLFTDELRSEQVAAFREHRHDQSVFSLLWKCHGFRAYADLTDPSEYGNFAIIAFRNNTGLHGYYPRGRLQARRYRDLLIDKFLRIVD